jgi:hypothetical protein
MINVLDGLLAEIARYESLRAKILDRIANKTHQELVTNLHQLLFDFETKTVEIVYYVEDDNYPPLRVSFADLKAAIMGI